MAAGAGKAGSDRNGNIGPQGPCVGTARLHGHHVVFLGVAAAQYGTIRRSCLVVPCLIVLVACRSCCRVAIYTQYNNFLNWHLVSNVISK